MLLPYVPLICLLKSTRRWRARCFLSPLCKAPLLLLSRRYNLAYLPLEFEVLRLYVENCRNMTRGVKCYEIEVCLKLSITDIRALPKECAYNYF